MAANDEFPRGVVLSVATVATQIPTITLPGWPSIAWVLTEVDAEIVTLTGFAGPFTCAVADTVNSYEFGLLSVNSVGAKDTLSWTGNHLYQAGVAVPVQFTVATPANALAYLVVHAYPI